MGYRDVFSVLQEYVSGERCFRYVEGIHSTDRWFNFRMFEKTAGFCAEQMEKAGLSEVELLPLRADGRTPYGDWVIPKAWDARKGVLKIVSPSVEDPILADYEKIPQSLVMYSAPTPAGGISAEVIIVDDPKNVEPESVKGKIIFTSALKPQALVDLALKGGAVGIVSDFFPMYEGIRDSRQDVYDAVRWENAFKAPVNDSCLFAFSLSPRKGDYLRELVKKCEQSGEKLVLSAEVQTEFYDGVCYTVSGLIPGCDPSGEEVFIYGHLYEPGANDNASGCATILEIATALNKAINDGRLPRPRRGIRFAMGWECGGSMGYVHAHPDRVEKTVAAMVCDMVGASEKDRADYHLWHNTLSNWSYTDTLILALEREYRRFSGDNGYKTVIDRFSIATDNILSDPIFGMPTAAILMYPALSYHSSYDTMDLVDPKVLRRSAMIAGTYLYTIADFRPDDIRWLLSEIKKHASEEIEKRSAVSEAQGCLISALFRSGCLSLKDLTDDEDVKREIDAVAGELPLKPLPAEYSLEGDDIKEKGGDLVPVRIVKGTLNFSQLTREQMAESKWHPSWNDALNTPLFWADGKRTMREIAVMSAVELGKTDIKAYFDETMEYFRFLEKHGFIKFI